MDSFYLYWLEGLIFLELYVFGNGFIGLILVLVLIDFLIGVNVLRVF